MPHEHFQLLFKSVVLVAAIGVSTVGGILTFTGKISPWTGRFYSLLDPSYAKNNIPIIASVSEHQPTTWSSFYFDLQLLVFMFPVGLYYCFYKLTDANIFIIMYGVTSIYFAVSENLLSSAKMFGTLVLYCWLKPMLHQAIFPATHLAILLWHKWSIARQVAGMMSHCNNSKICCHIVRCVAQSRTDFYFSQWWQQQNCSVECLWQGMFSCNLCHKKIAKQVAGKIVCCKSNEDRVKMDSS